MSTHKHIDKICALAAVAALLLAILFMFAPSLGVTASESALGYESRLFDTERVHTIDIQMDDWDSFIASAQSEEYSLCTLTIDGETFANVGLRGKGNTSLTSVASMDSERYSFKVEFDQYDSTKSYHGLDKLSLNNLIQDASFMKDYLVYRLMASFGAAAPLCSFVYITVNGSDWGLYLAVEGIEDSFLRRNYGSDYGELYKPDSMGMGGGRGNGRDFSMDDFSLEDAESPRTAPAEGGFDRGGMNIDRGGGMGSSDVLLQYSGDDASAYPNIFDNAKTDVTEADRQRLIAALKTLSEGENPEAAVDTEAVLRYFVVHNYVVNGDSYTGGMVHNYYLYEEQGVLSMLPWDYNLAFGSFQGSSASAAVNDPIDSPLSVGSGDSRPMIDWIFSSEEYTARYHELFGEFLDTVDAAAIIDHARSLIAPYVKKDPTAFYSYEEFEQGAATLREFCLLRSESVRGQLEGLIPSTDAGQSAAPDALIAADHINISDMGSMGGGMGGRGDTAAMPGGSTPQNPTEGHMPQMPTEGRIPQQGGNMAQMPQQGGKMELSPDMGRGEIGAVRPEAPADSGNGSPVLAIACAAALALGLTIALLYKRR